MGEAGARGAGVPRGRPARRTIGTEFARNRNGFDLLRLLAALLVLASHAFVLTGNAGDEPVAPLLGHVTDGGGLAVGAFFALSGFLIARSAQVHPVRTYIKARVLRLYPGFVAVLLLQTFVLGPIATSLPAGGYLSDPQTWFALARGLAFSPPPGLPGVFGSNPLADQVNGSLWTLRIEVLCYAGLLGLHRAGLLRPGRVALPLAGGWGLLAAVLAARAGLLPAGLAGSAVPAITDCVLHFLMGAALWCWRDRVPLRWSWAVAAILGFAATARTPLGPAMLHVVLPYLVLGFGFILPPAGRMMSRVGDISYGTYLAAFPIEQGVVAMTWPGLTAWTLIACAAPLALLYGLLSRHLVEVPFLRLRTPVPCRGGIEERRP